MGRLRPESALVAKTSISLLDGGRTASASAKGTRGEGRFGGVGQRVSEDTQGEDGCGQGVAGEPRVAVEKSGEDFVVVLWGSRSSGRGRGNLG